jgi:molybdopterin molybdotransferase
LAALVETAGGIAVRAPLAKDEPDATREALATALASSDLLLTVGGVSVGDHDVVRPALEALGAHIDFWKVAMRPGKPLVLARHGRTLVLGLPGNPVSAQVTFALFGIPLLRALQGDRTPRPSVRRAHLTKAIRQRPGRRGFHRAILSGSDVSLLENQASGAVTAMAWANALVVVPAEVSELAAGQLVDVLAFADF